MNNNQTRLFENKKIILGLVAVVIVAVAFGVYLLKPNSLEPNQQSQLTLKPNQYFLYFYLTKSYQTVSSNGTIVFGYDFDIQNNCSFRVCNLTIAEYYKGQQVNVKNLGDTILKPFNETFTDFETSGSFLTLYPLNQDTKLFALGFAVMPIQHEQLTFTNFVWATDRSYAEIAVKNTGVIGFGIKLITIEGQQQMTFTITQWTLESGDSSTIRVIQNFVSGVTYNFSIKTYSGNVYTYTMTCP